MKERVVALYVKRNEKSDFESSIGTSYMFLFFYPIRWVAYQFFQKLGYNNSM